MLWRLPQNGQNLCHTNKSLFSFIQNEYLVKHRVQPQVQERWQSCFTAFVLLYWEIWCWESRKSLHQTSANICGEKLIHWISVTDLESQHSFKKMTCYECKRQCWVVGKITFDPVFMSEIGFSKKSQCWVMELFDLF